VSAVDGNPGNRAHPVPVWQPAHPDHFFPSTFQIAHTPRITQDQAANQQRIRRLQCAVNYYFGRQPDA